jgi:DNA-binding MarR family transcriptional regulator
MTSLIDRMEGAGLVRRDDHPTDRRAYQICLTSRGRELEKELDRVVVRAYKHLTRGIAEEDLGISTRVCERLIQNAG